MPRKSRIDAPGALHHVMGRGIEGSEIYRGDGDRDDFLSRLETVLSETGTRCYAWTLIPNHFHLLLKSGKEPLSTVMRRLLTGYSVSFNRRHSRHGHLFQNRYKSILCQEDAYLLELVRYIHLNPLRAGIVSSMPGLEQYLYCGHSALMGVAERPWQDTDWVLGFYSDSISDARRRLKRFMQAGIRKGRRPELMGGGLVRSLGGWSEVRKTRDSGNLQKSDERILGDTSFVTEVLESCEEKLDRKHSLRAGGLDFEGLAARVSAITKMHEWQILKPSKERPRVKARSLLCYWAVREMGMSMADLSRKLGISLSGISQHVNRGETIAREGNFQLPDVAKVNEEINEKPNLNNE